MQAVIEDHKAGTTHVSKVYSHQLTVHIEFAQKAYCNWTQIQIYTVKYR